MRTSKQLTTGLLTALTAVFFALPAIGAQTDGNAKQSADQQIKPSKEGRGKGSDWAGQKVEKDSGTDCQNRANGQNAGCDKKSEQGTDKSTTKAKK